MSHRVICIGRQFGSGGHDIAVRLSSLLGIPIYERDILGLACEYGGVDKAVLADVDEKAANPYLFTAIHEGNYHITRGIPTNDALYLLQSHEIRRIAKKEDCIFVGRCADVVLRGRDVRMLSVFVAAPFEQRVQHKMQQENLPLDKTRRLVKKMDHQRAKYYTSHADTRWGTPEQYDLYLDTGVITPEEAVKRIAEAFAAL